LRLHHAKTHFTLWFFEFPQQFQRESRNFKKCQRGASSLSLHDAKLDSPPYFPRFLGSISMNSTTSKADFGLNQANGLLESKTDTSNQINT
jgi:hypothetical protein